MKVTNSLPVEAIKKREKNNRVQAVAEKHHPKAWRQMTIKDKDELLKAVAERAGMWEDPED